MALPRIDLLVKSGRILSLQRDYGDAYGVDQEFFVEAFNKGLLLAQQRIVNTLAEVYSQYKDYPITSQTETLAVPSDAFIDDLVYEVRYSPTGNREDLGDPLRRNYIRGNGNSGEPEGFAVQGGLIYLDLEPTSGMVRIRYEGILPKVGLRKGKILSSTGTLPEVTSITLVDDSDFNTLDWETPPEYLTVVDYAGNILMKAIPVLSIDSGTRVITVRSGFAAQDSETIPEDSYICFGDNTSSHIKLPRVGELFLLQYVQDEVNDLLSSDDQPVSSSKQEEYLKQLTIAYELLPAGPVSIARTNSEGF